MKGKERKSIYFMTYFYAPISTIVSGVLQPPIISLQRTVTIIIRASETTLTYNWHLDLLWVSVIYT